MATSRWKGMPPALWACALAITACAPGLAGTVQTGPAITELVADNTVGPGDVFTVRVFQEKDLSGDYLVSSDGAIYFPLVGRVDVLSLTPAEVGNRLQKALETYLKHPEVAVLVKEYNSKKVYVFGHVEKPGTFSFEDGMSIIQVITQAGGLKKTAAGNSTHVTRVVDGNEQRIPVPVHDISNAKSKNFYLRPGDIIYVPESFF